MKNMTRPRHREIVPERYARAGIHFKSIPLKEASEDEERETCHAHQGKTERVNAAECPAENIIPRGRDSNTRFKPFSIPSIPFDADQMAASAVTEIRAAGESERRLSRR